MQKILWTALAGAMVGATSPCMFANANTVAGTHAAWQVHEPARFMVSGVLRKDGTTDTIRPVQGIVVADTADVALQIFVRQVRHDYPGYSLLSTLTSSIPRVGRCESTI